MGNDISVFDDKEFESDMEVISKDESLLELFNKSLVGMTNVLTQPVRFQYESSWYKSDNPSCIDYSFTEYELAVNGVSLHCVRWTKNDTKSNVCIVYLHTNARASCNAVELLPLCNLLGADLMSFDMRGCGKTEGSFSLNNAKDLAAVVKSLLIKEKNNKVEIVLWARGISTYVAVEYASSKKLSPNVVFLVLDSPFTTVTDIVYEAASNIETAGITVPSLFIRFALRMVRKKLTDQLGADPYHIQPIKLVPRVRLPCFILSADNDTYISEYMGDKVYKAFLKSRKPRSSVFSSSSSSSSSAEEPKVRVWYRTFPGEHFGERDECLVMTPFDKMLPFLHRTDQGKSDNGETTDSDDDEISEDDEDYATTPLARQSGVGEGEIAWNDDNSVTECELCRVKFSMFNRRHHCRNCGSVICAACSKQKILLTHMMDTYSDPVRVCDVCHEASGEPIV